MSFDYGKRIFAQIGLCKDDVLMRKPMTDEEAERFLEANAFILKESMIEAGTQKLESLLVAQNKMPDPKQLRLEFA